MKKYAICLLFLYFSVAFCEITKQSYSGMLKLVTFKGHSIEFYDALKKKSGEADDLWNRSFEYNFVTKGKLDYLVLNGYKEPLLALKSDELLILFNNAEMLFMGVNKPLNEEFIDFVPKLATKCSTELKEGEKRYASENLCNLNLCEPWAEGEKGYGVGEKIFTSINGNGLLIFSGYVSYSNPKLYSDNPRPKRIKVLLKEKNREYIFELKDTPNPQRLEFEELYNGEIEITLLDIYKGARYKDTCINSIMYYIRVESF